MRLWVEVRARGRGGVRVRVRARVGVRGIALRLGVEVVLDARQ